MAQQTLRLEQASAPARGRAQHLHSVAAALEARLERPETITRHLLRRLMVEAYGASDADGGWSLRDAYDALETALVLHVIRQSPTSGETRETAFARVKALQGALPTQTYRSERQIDMQQFSTPLTLAWLAAQAARLTPRDTVLEPSAGTGMLAAHAIAAGARVILNERDAARAELLARITGREVTRHDAEFIHDALHSEVRPTVVLVNPPFSRSEGRGKDRHAGARHLRSALLRLAPAGRCVAIMPPNFAADASGAAGYAAVAEAVPPRVEITILGHPYAKHGTSIAVRLIVFDKGWTGTPARHVAESIDEALHHLLDLPARLDHSPEPPPQCDALARPKPLHRTAQPALFADIVGRPPAAPQRIIEPHAATALDYKARAVPLAPGDPIGIYAPWRLSRITISEAQPHP
ncbi:MAG: methylase, partial [Sphingopyxis sp.]|nr:methylase [Sphingopyxis sp.]